MSRPTLTLNTDAESLTLTTEKTTGNKQTIARLHGEDDQYGLDREWLAGRGQGTYHDDVAEGDLIEVRWWSHSGNEKSASPQYFQVSQDSLAELSDDELSAKLPEQPETETVLLDDIEVGDQIWRDRETKTVKETETTEGVGWTADKKTLVLDDGTEYEAVPNEVDVERVTSPVETDGDEDVDRGEGIETDGGDTTDDSPLERITADDVEAGDILTQAQFRDDPDAEDPTRGIALGWCVEVDSIDYDDEGRPRTITAHGLTFDLDEDEREIPWTNFCENVAEGGLRRFRSRDLAEGAWLYRAGVDSQKRVYVLREEDGRTVADRYDFETVLDWSQPRDDGPGRILMPSTAHSCSRPPAAVIEELWRLGYAVLAGGAGYERAFDALERRGCTPTQARDYLACDVLGQTHQERADATGRNRSSVSGNVSEARDEINYGPGSLFGEQKFASTDIPLVGGPTTTYPS